MRPLQELLSRIRWDKEFGKGRFEIGYDDHLEKRSVRILFEEIVFQEGNPFYFHARNPDGQMVAIPYHRVREVYKDGTLIWQRPRRTREQEK
jgi:uncharacterized protein (UPF0248 family)